MDRFEELEFDTFKNLESERKLSWTRKNSLSEFDQNPITSSKKHLKREMKNTMLHNFQVSKLLLTSQQSITSYQV
jgi:hypothetical protein